MRTLYHFAVSPFSRRTRLALAHKGLEVELKDARATPAYMDEVRALNPLRTAPVLVDEGGRALADSGVITHYLDGAYPALPALWPSEPSARHAALAIAQLVDGALETLVDVGTHYYALHGDAAWKKVTQEMVGRAQGALNALGDRVATIGPRVLTDAGWCAADMWLYTAVAWLEGLPARASANTNAAQIVSLAWSVPASLSRWAEAHRLRADVRALD
jgi:glutathione S-transferase